ALPAELAARAVGSLAPEERIRLGDAGSPEVDRDRHGTEGVLGARTPRRLSQVVVHDAEVLVRDAPEHAGRAGEVRDEFGSPVGVAVPCRIAVELRRRFQQDTGPDDRSATHARATDDA